MTVRDARANAPEEVTSTQPASNDDTLQSQELMKQGAAKYARGDWLGAYEAYERAWERTPHSAIAANMAATEIKLGKYLQAATHLKYALNHLPPVQIEKRGAVQEQLEQLREHLVAVIGGAAATAISLGVGVAMRVESKHEQDDANMLSRQINSVSPDANPATNSGCVRQEQPQACALLSRSAEAAHRDKNISTAAFFTAGGFGVATIATFLLWPSSSGVVKSEHSGMHRLRLGTSLSERGFGLSAHGTF